MTSTVSSYRPATVSFDAPVVEGSTEILTAEALQLIGALHERFDTRRLGLLSDRVERQRRIDDGATLWLLPHTGAIRADSSWRVAPPGPGLSRRRVEMTGPVNRAMAVNALNSGADVWMADLEDATSPTWANLIEGQLNLLRLTRGELDFTTETGKRYRVGERTPTVMVRPRGWHLPEKHLLVDGAEVSASLTDVGLYFLHCAQAMIDRGAGPYFYLPKLESHLEARLWNDVFLFLQEWCGIPRGTVRATVLVETLPAAFEMEEILYELREHSAGLNAGRWDYIFSIIKTLRSRGDDAVLPDRADITMTTPFMRAYSERLVATCHRRGAHAIGGMAAFVPNRRDAEATTLALQRIRADKDRDAADGFDGSWVAHPGLVATAAEAFEAVLHDRDHQLGREVRAVGSPVDMLDLSSAGGHPTMSGLRSNIAVSLRYLDAWLQGTGAVAINDLMEDAATVEISRSQVWQWRDRGVVLQDGTVVTGDLVQQLITTEADLLRGCQAGIGITLADAVTLFEQLTLELDYVAFFTIPAYRKFLRD
ncbi:MAG: malate synthase [Frankiales bacterium]|jgi:malate synthase|nr:malate synthase [Frankiales bacterium]